MLGSKIPTYAKYEHNGDMLRWMCWHIGKNKIINEVMCNKVGVAPIKTKMTETR